MPDEPKIIDRRPVEWTTFEAGVNAPDLRPMVTVACGVGDERVWASKQSPAVTTALGLRAIQSAIEAERDAALVAFLRDELGPQMGLTGKDATGFAAMCLDGLRRHRQQFDAAAGSSSALLSDEDPSGPPR